MEEDFPVVVEPEVWGMHFHVSDGCHIICNKCDEPLPLAVDFSVLHLLWLVKRHLKEAHNG